LEPIVKKIKAEVKNERVQHVQKIHLALPDWVSPDSNTSKFFVAMTFFDLLKKCS